MEDKNDGRMGWDQFLFLFWALSFEIIKFQPLINNRSIDLASVFYCLQNTHSFYISRLAPID